MLKLQCLDKRGSDKLYRAKQQDVFWVTEKSFSIGTAVQNNLVVTGSSVSTVHAKLVSRGDVYHIKDLNSEVGTLVNGRRVTQKPVACGDVIAIGPLQLQVLDPRSKNDPSGAPYWSLIAASGGLSGREFGLFNDGKSVAVVGRGEGCDVVFPGIHLAREHAVLSLGDDHLLLRDLDSANGTFVNDVKTQTAQLKSGDLVRFDVHSFRVFGLFEQSSNTCDSESPGPAITNDGIDSPEPAKAWCLGSTSPGNKQEFPSESSHLPFSVTALGLLASLVALALYLAVGA